MIPKQLAFVGVCGIALGMLSLTMSYAQSSRPSAVSCDRYARDYAENSSRRGQMLGGAAKGSLLGAGIGAIAGGAGTGAAIGAIVGVVGGGARRSSTAERMYSVAYQDCMAGRAR